MRAHLLLSSLLLVACAVPASNPPPTPAAAPTHAPTASASTAPPPTPPATPPEPAGPPLAGTLAATVTDDSGFVYDTKPLLDQHALDACYEGHLAIPNPHHPGLPGWARFRLVSAQNQRTVTVTPLDDSNLPAGLRSCLLTAVSKTNWSPGPTTKLLYLSLR